VVDRLHKEGQVGLNEAGGEGDAWVRVFCEVKREKKENFTAGEVEVYIPREKRS